MERVNELLDFLFLLGSAPQLKLHVLHGEVIFNFATIIFFAGVTMRVAPQSNHLALIDVPGDARTRVAPYVNGLRMCKLDRKDQRQQN